MPKKITHEMKNEIVRLRDEEELPWKEVGEEVGISRNTARKYYEKEKDSRDQDQDKGGGGEETQLSAEVFEMFDNEKSPVDLVREGVAGPEKVKELWEKYKELNEEGIKEIKTESYNEGYQDAKEQYRIWYQCKVCGDEITITPGSKVHREVKKCLKNWGHESCLDKY